MSDNRAAFADEFGRALTEYGTEGKGQWFGRLIAFGYNVQGFRGKDYTEDEFRAKIDDQAIQIKAFEIEGEPTVSGDTITGTAKIEGAEDGTYFKERVAFTHTIKPALHSHQTIFKTINDTDEIPSAQAADSQGLGVEIPLHALTQLSDTHEWDDPKFSWFIWQYSRSLEIYSDGQWFGRLTDGGYTVDILGQNVTKAAIVQSFENSAARILFAIDTTTVKYTDHGNGTATAVCQAKIGGNIGGVNIPDGLYTLTHRIRLTTSVKTPWVADSSTIT